MRHHPAPAAGREPLLKATLARLKGVLEEENAALCSSAAISHAALTERKNQVLRELMAARAVSTLDPACEEELRQIRVLLARNAVLLKAHIAALGEVSDMIVAGLRAAESDGTYSARGAVR